MNLQSFYGVLYVMLFAFTLSTYAFVRVEQERPILFMEMCITGISSFMYYLFIQRLKTQSLHAISILRYKGWAITTPLMIVALSLLLRTNVSLVYLIGLDWLMLLAGYLGELRLIPQFTATIAGFIPFFLLFYGLYSTATFTTFTYAIFWIYFAVWTCYGLAYLCKESTKNSVMNVLDCLAKAVVAICVSIHFISGGIV
jgi:bacteriorhodopsin